MWVTVMVLIYDINDSVCSCPEIHVLASDIDKCHWSDSIQCIYLQVYIKMHWNVLCEKLICDIEINYMYF